MRALFDLAEQRGELARVMAAATTDADDDGWEMALLDTLEGLDGELADVIDQRLRTVLSLEADADTCRVERRRLELREARMRRMALSVRQMIVRAMQEADVRALPLALGTVSRQRGRESVVITDEKAIPSQLTVTTRRPDKKAIGEQLRAGETVPGAALERGADTLRIGS